MISGQILGQHRYRGRRDDESSLLPLLPSAWNGRFELEVEVPKTFDELRAQCNLPYPPMEDFKYRVEQGRAVLNFLRNGADYLCNGETRAGKTVVSMLIASHYLNKVEKVWFIAPGRELVKQPIDKDAAFVGIPPEHLHLIDSSMSERKIKSLMEKDTGIFFMTPEKARNIFLKFNLPPHLLIVDEADVAVKDSASAQLISRLPSSTRMLFLSATPRAPKRVTKHEAAKSKQKVLEVPKRLQNAMLLPLPSVPQLLTERTVTVSQPLDIANSLSALFRVFKDIAERADSYLKDKPNLQEEFRALIAPQDEVAIPHYAPLKEFFNSTSGVINYGPRIELNKFRLICYYHEVLTLMGEGAFINAVLNQERKAQSKMMEVQKKAALEGVKAKTKTFSCRELWKHEEFVLLFQDIVKRNGLPELANISSFIQKSPPSEATLIEKLASNTDRIQPKEEALLKILQSIPKDKFQHGVYIYVNLKFQVKLLTRRLEYLLDEAHSTTGSLIGGQSTAAERENRRLVCQMFKEGKINIMTGTTTITRGIDSDAEVLINFVAPPNGRTYRQIIGRVGRKHGKVGSIYNLLSHDSPDSYRFRAAKSYMRSLEKKRREIERGEVGS